MSADAATAHIAAPAPAAAPTTRTGGPKDDNKLAEHVCGWTLVAVLAMFLTQTGLV